MSAIFLFFQLFEYLVSLVYSVYFVKKRFSFLLSTNNIIDKYMLLRKSTNKEYKRKYKPWITRGILKSIDQKNKLHQQIVKYKDPKIKEDIYTKYKVIKNRITDI